MKAIDLTTKTQGLHVRLDGSPVYDFLAALYLTENWTAGRDFEVERRWVQRARRALGPPLRRELSRFARRRGVGMGLVSLLERKADMPVRAFVRLVAAQPPAELLERLLTAPLAARPAAPLLRAYLAERTDAALRAFLAAYPPEWDPARLRALATAPPAEIRDRLVGLLKGFYARVYEQEEASVLPLLRADLAAKQRLAAALPPGELIERATGGFSIEPGSVAQVVLAPSFFFRPYNLICEYPGARVFIYPVASSAATASPAAELARRFKALGDPTRMRILQMLGERERYLQEIANRLGVSHVTALHHLALLRAAHLVRVIDRQNQRFYQVRPEAAAELKTALTSLVGGASERAARRG